MTSHPQQTVVFTTLAMNQTLFFAAVGKQLEHQARGVVYVCFHERSHEYLQSIGAKAYNVFRISGTKPEAVELAKYGGDQLNLLVSHEKAAFEEFGSTAFVDKYRRYIAAIESIFDDIKRDTSGEIVLVQELGGFLSILAAFYVARARGVDNIFIEPSFFRGRVFFGKNTFGARSVDGRGGKEVSPEVRHYLSEALRQQQVVIPVKDRAHYRAAGKKLRDTRNIRRLFEKAADKYLFGRREEFEHIGGHVSRHVRMYVKSMVLRRQYRPLPDRERFIYYPLHVPADFALTIRSPQFFDQYSLIDYLARIAPPTHMVAIKEHPALIGAVELVRIRDLLRRRSNILFLDPRINNYEVMSAADAIITVNSKSGAEALLLGKPVVVLGDAFYSASPLVRRTEVLSQLPHILGEILASDRPPYGPEERDRYFQNVWDESFPGELYDVTEANVATFACSLQEALSGQRAV